MLEPLILILPTFVVAGFVAWKMPVKAKKYFFMIPIWLSSLAGAILIHNLLGGASTVAKISALVCDAILMPLFAWIKHRYEKKHGKVPTWKELFSMPALTPAPVPT